MRSLQTAEHQAENASDDKGKRDHAPRRLPLGCGWPQTPNALSRVGYLLIAGLDLEIHELSCFRLTQIVYFGGDVLS
jgi:hypothetical protein